MYAKDDISMTDYVEPTCCILIISLQEEMFAWLNDEERTTFLDSTHVVGTEKDQVFEWLTKNGSSEQGYVQWGLCNSYSVSYIL